jgi:hypothetical protein
VWTCTDMGQLDSAVVYGRRAEALLPHLETDQELIRIILTGLGIAHWFRGDGRQAIFQACDANVYLEKAEAFVRRHRLTT